MAVPNSAYSTKNLNTIRNETTFIHNIALPAGETASTIKARFYLDGLFNTSEGFVGMVYPNGANYKMHKSTRIGVINAYYNGQQVLLNDAGLNTKGVVSAPTITNTRIGSFAGEVTAKSAYYVYSDAVQWEFNLNGQGYVQTPATISGLQQNTTQTLPFSNSNLFNAGDTVYFRARISNAEGEYIGAESIQYTIRLRAVILSTNQYASTAWADWNGGERITYYTDKLAIAFNAGGRLYVDDPINPANAQYAPATYYSDGVYWYQVNYVAARDRNEIVARGTLTSSSGYPDNWPSNDPQYDKLISNAQQGTWYEGTTYEDACTAGQNQSNSINVWLRSTEKGRQTYYRDQAGTTALSGYFHTGGGVYQYVGGARSGNPYQCPN